MIVFDLQSHKVCCETPVRRFMGGKYSDKPSYDEKSVLVQIPPAKDMSLDDFVRTFKTGDIIFQYNSNIEDNGVPYDFGSREKNFYLLPD